MVEQQRLRLLVVDGNVDDRESLARHLRRQGIASVVDTEGTAAAARACLQESSYDLVVMEYELSDATAFDFLPALNGTPSLMLVATGSVNVAVEALRRGVYDYVVKDGGGAYLDGLPSTIANVLARRRAELALKDSEARYQDLFDNAPDMYLHVDEDARIITVNRRGADQLGYDIAELVGQPIYRVVHAEDSAIVRRQIQAASRRPKVVHRASFRVVRKDGTALQVAESLSVQQAERTPFQFRMLCRDITAQTEAERREQQLQDRLVRSERLESIGILAGGVAHDLNNILGPMVAYPDLLLESFEDGSENHELTMEIKRSAMQAAAVIRDLLTMARRGRYPLEPLDLNEVVSRYLNSALCRDLARGAAAVNMQVLLGEGLPPVSGSAVNLVKVLMNLVMNAYEAMEDGGDLRIETALLTTERRLGYEPIPQGCYVTLAVADTGAGIAPDDLDRLFEPFFTRKEMGRSGSGLGLSVVYGVVKDHRAFIDVQSVEGQGSVFTIFFPALADSVLPGPDTEAEEDLRGHERILIVDDSERQSALGVKLLSALGYDVFTAASGQEALRVMEEAEAGKHGGRFDLVLLDMVMEPDMDGLDTYQEMRNRNPEQKCVLVSGFAESARAKQAQSLGVRRFLAKPYSVAELGRTVRQVLDGD
jgi:PAS domain S-box-containing protein